MSDETTASVLNVKLRAMLDGWKENIQSAQKDMENFTKKVEDNREALHNTGIKVGAVGASIVASLGLATKAAADEEEVFKRLENQLKVNGVSWEQNKGKITDWYEKLQATTKYGDTDAVGVLQKMSIFVKDLDQAMAGSKLSMDMAASGLFDVDTAARMVGMAYSGNIMMLGRYIPELKSSNNAALESMDANQKAAYALEVLQKKFGGLAEGELKTTNAAFTQMGNYLGDIVENVGHVLNPIMAEFAKTMTAVAKEVRDFTSEHQTITTALTLIAAALGGILTGIGGLLLATSGLPAVLKAFKELSAVLDTFVLPAIGKLSAAMGMSAGGMGLVLAGIAAALVLIIKYWDEISAGFETAYEEIIGPVLSAMKEGFDLVWEKVKQVFESIYSKIANTFGGMYMILDPVVRLFIDGFGSVWETVKWIFGKIWDTISSVLENMYNGFRWVLDKLGIELPELSNVFGDIKEASGNAVDAIVSKWNSMGEAFKRNLEENKNKNKVVQEEIKIDTANTSEAIKGKKKEEKEEINKLAEQITKENKKELEQRKLDEAKASDEKLEKYMETIAEMKEKYGEFLTDEQIMQAAHLKVTNQDYLEYVDEARSEYEKRWSTTYKEVQEGFSDDIDLMADDMMDSLASGNFNEALGVFEGGFSSAFGNILKSLQSNLLDKIKDSVSDFFSGLGNNISGLAGSLTALGAIALGAKVVNQIVGEFTPDYEARRKDRERNQALTRGYYTLEGVQQELTGSEWQFSRENLFQLKASINSLKEKKSLNAQEKLVLKGYEEMWADMELAAAAGYGFQVLTELMKEDPEYISKLQGGTINFSDVASMGRSSDLYKKNMPSFHSGGIITGALGQERTVRALAGEEIITRNDPRHSLNFGGLNVIIQGNYINSELDVRNIGRVAGEEIMKQLRLQEALSF